jgi:DNA primase
MQLNNVFIEWFKQAKITEEIISKFGVYFDDRIIFPVHDYDGSFIYNKYRRNPMSEEGSKYTFDKGSKISLYGYNHAKDFNTLLITEGEKDCLVAWSHNIPAISSTAGAMSFQSEWVELLKDKDLIVCLDNDKAGGEGIVKILDMIPSAKVIFIPDMPNVKDIADYVAIGGNLHELVKTAREFKDIAEVKEDRIKRLAYFQSVHFHDAYIKKHTKVNNYVGDGKRTWSSDMVSNARQYPIPQLLELDKTGKCICPFHFEKTPSLNYYKKTNTCYCFGGCGKAYDAIDIYRHIHNCTFKEAVKALNK